jgi:hypothetical protein
MRAWYVVCIAVLASLHPSRCAKAKLPSWRGPNALFDGTMPSNRTDHGFASVDGRIYVFGGFSGEIMCADNGKAKISYTKKQQLAPTAA